MTTDLNYQEIADNFARIAARFCEVVELAEAVEKPELIAKVYRLLPEIIGAAITLPLPDFGDGEESAEKLKRKGKILTMHHVSHDERHKIYLLLKSKLGDSDLYHMVFDPTKDDQAIFGSLADDISDIYRDLKPMLNLNASRSFPPEDVIFEWYIGFYSHWGRHAMNALTACHFLLAEAFL